MASDHETALRPGTEFDGYRFEEILGAGGFGITYKAFEPMLDRHVAIKEFMPSGMATRGSDGLEVRPLGSGHLEDFNWGMGRFRTEAQTLVSFRHPNIVQVFRYFEANNTGYLVMDFVEGQTLGAYLAPDRTLPEPELRRLLDILMDGLGAVHARGFLHRDIKPANIILREDGGGMGQPVLIDFGAARQALGQHSKSLTAIISEGYAPYEQYDSSGDQGAWSDVYALGGVLYRCVAGERPPDAPSRVSALVRGRDDPMTSAAEAARGDYAPELLAAIDEALAIREDDRPQSIEAFAALLAPGAAKTEIVDMPPATDAGDAAGQTQVVTPAAPPPPADETRIAGNAPLAAPQQIAAAPATPPVDDDATEPSRPIAEERAPPPATPRNRKPIIWAVAAAAVLAIGAGAWALVGQSGGDGGDPSADRAGLPAILRTPPALDWRSTLGDRHRNSIKAIRPDGAGGLFLIGVWHWNLIGPKGKYPKDTAYRQSQIWLLHLDARGYVQKLRRLQYKGQETGIVDAQFLSDGSMAILAEVNSFASIHYPASKPRGYVTMHLDKDWGELDAQGRRTNEYGPLVKAQDYLDYTKYLGGHRWLISVGSPIQLGQMSDAIRLEPIPGLQSHYSGSISAVFNIGASSRIFVGQAQQKKAASMEVLVGRHVGNQGFRWVQRYTFRKYAYAQVAHKLPDGSVQILCITHAVPVEVIDKEKRFDEVRGCLLHVDANGKLIRRREFGAGERFVPISAVRLKTGHTLAAGATVVGDAKASRVHAALALLDSAGRFVWIKSYPNKVSAQRFGLLAWHPKGGLYAVARQLENGKRTPGRFIVVRFRAP